MNDERPIEKLLRRYATRRRDEAGAAPELHPATRRLLQGEVARQYPKPVPDGKSPQPGFFALLAQRWAYALGIFLVLGVAAVMILPSLNNSTSHPTLAQKAASENLAMRESVAPGPAPTLAAAPPAETQPMPTLADLAEERSNEPAAAARAGGNLTRSRDESALNYSVTSDSSGSTFRVADVKKDAPPLSRAQESKPTSLGANLDSATPAGRSLSAPSPRRAPTTVVPSDSISIAQNARSGRDDTAGAPDGFAEKREAKAATPTGAAALPAVVATGLQDKSIDALAGAAEKEADAIYSQSFANVATEQLKAKVAKVAAEAPAIPVLANFQVQQVGNQVRVVDGDGSTYLGELTTAAARIDVGDKASPTGNFARQGARPASSPTSGLNVNQPTTQNYLWRVEGTNRTLNQNVVFSWNFIETNGTSATSQLNAAAGTLKQDAAKQPAQFQQLLNNSVINGRAQLGPAQQIEVNAVPVKP